MKIESWDSYSTYFLFTMAIKENSHQHLVSCLSDSFVCVTPRQRIMCTLQFYGRTQAGLSSVLRFCAHLLARGHFPSALSTRFHWTDMTHSQARYFPHSQHTPIQWWRRELWPCLHGFKQKYVRFNLKLWLTEHICDALSHKSCNKKCTAYSVAKIPFILNAVM